MSQNPKLGNRYSDLLPSKTISPHGDDIAVHLCDSPAIHAINFDEVTTNNSTVCKCHLCPSLCTLNPINLGCSTFHQSFSFPLTALSLSHLINILRAMGEVSPHFSLWIHPSQETYVEARINYSTSNPFVLLYFYRYLDLHEEKHVCKS